VFPGDVCLNKKRVRNDRPKSTQRGDETELANFFAKIEIELDAAKMFLTMERRQVALNWEFERPKPKHDYQRNENADHNSFP
jgi:hypothetical protein